jgi:hypothetical protein
MTSALQKYYCNKKIRTCAHQLYRSPCTGLGSFMGEDVTYYIIGQIFLFRSEEGDVDGLLSIFYGSLCDNSVAWIYTGNQNRSLLRQILYSPSEDGMSEIFEAEEFVRHHTRVRRKIFVFRLYNPHAWPPKDA